MSNDLNINSEHKTTSGYSTRNLLLKELHLASKRLLRTPFPFCESDCPWISICRKIKATECISAFLLEINASKKGCTAINPDVHISWH
jgi:hypothetical protein